MLCTGNNPVQIDASGTVLVPIYSVAMPFNYSQYSCDNGTGTIFTPGEIILSLFLLWIWSTLIIKMFLDRVYGVKIHG
jgi:hypothetical protein